MNQTASVRAPSCFDTPCYARLLSTHGLFLTGERPFALSSPRSGRIEGFCHPDYGFFLTGDIPFGRFDKLRTGLSSPRSGRIETCPEPVEAGFCHDQLGFPG